ncbi:GL23530 [Drosophila persimilis]|uniref:GL23530 n=1 Tax=Drosophila persimilis TaxID=7234 RepID=B4G2X7_DROPE|nr:GL23530 [Drosophila persimilis]
MELTIPMKYLVSPQNVLMMDAVLEDDQMIHTEAPVWKDTRYHFQHQSRQPRIRLESSPIMEFYPDDGKINTVCWNKSTISGTDMTIPLNRRHLVGPQGTYPVNTSHMMEIAGNRSRLVVDYDLGLSDQAKDSISAGRGIRLFQIPSFANAQTKREYTGAINTTGDITSSHRSTKNYDEKRKPRARDGEGEGGGGGGGGGEGEVVVNEAQEKTRARDGDGDGEGGDVVQSQEKPVDDVLAMDQEDDEEGSDKDEEEVMENKLSTVSSARKELKVTQLDPDPELLPEPEAEDEEDRDDDDVEEIEDLAKKSDAAEQNMGFKDLLGPKTPRGFGFLNKQGDSGFREAISYAGSWKDTRRGEVEKCARSCRRYVPIPSRPTIPSNTKNISTVCKDRSSIMNFPRVVKWLHKVLTNITYTQRPIFVELRRELFKFGKSELCHKTTMVKWKDYQYCALMRNQRMEYMIPHYPLHQIGYRLLFKAKKGA